MGEGEEEQPYSVNSYRTNCLRITTHTWGHLRDPRGVILVNKGVILVNREVILVDREVTLVSREVILVDREVPLVSREVIQASMEVIQASQEVTQASQVTQANREVIQARRVVTPAPAEEVTRERTMEDIPASQDSNYLKLSSGFYSNSIVITAATTINL